MPKKGRKGSNAHAGGYAHPGGYAAMPPPAQAWHEWAAGLPPQSQPTTPRTAASAATTPRKRHRKNKQNAHGGGNNGNQGGDNGNQQTMTKAQVIQLFGQMYARGGQPKPHNQQDREVRSNDKGNDVAVAKNNILRKDRVYGDDRTWSNYPFALPPTLDAKIVDAVQKSLSSVNNARRLNYSYENDWELGVLECYEGVSENEEPNFLSCDLVNPAYLKQYEKEYLPDRQNPKDAPTRWMPNWSFFVYAPPDTILSIKEKEGKRPLSLSEAKQNWKNYATGTAIPESYTPDKMGATLLPQFWFYKEEFIEFENRSKDRVYPKFKPVKYKGRIGMFFPIVPVEPESGDVLHRMDEKDDRIGWGVVTRIGGELDPEKKPKTWNELQTKIGRYIVLTNVWSSDAQDEYDVYVHPNVLKDIYAKVCQITKGDMFVSVRRGCNGYGRLCVLQKNIVIDPQDEKFGLEDKKKEPTNLYVTQIFTAGKSITKGPGRKAVTEAWKHDSMSFEEKNLCTIMQNFNNSVIACMKNEGYRGVMVAFWNKKLENRLASMAKVLAIEEKWTQKNIESMIVRMFSVGYELIFERGACKVACGERFFRLSNILTNYRIWFAKSKCMADDAFVKEYEDARKEEAIDYSSFTGMMKKLVRDTTDPTQPSGQAQPVFHTPNRRTVLTKMPPAAMGGLNLEQMARIHEASLRKEREIKTRIQEAVLKTLQETIKLWSGQNAGAGATLEEVRAWILDQNSNSSQKNRYEIALDVYTTIREKAGQGETLTQDGILAQCNIIFENHFRSIQYDDVNWREAERESLREYHPDLFVGRARTASPEPDRGGGGREMSVPHAATAINSSPAFRATSPGAYFNEENADMGLEEFINSHPLFKQYAGYQTAIRKVSRELTNVKIDEKGNWTCNFINGFQDLPRSRYLIVQYIHALPLKKDFLDTEAGREIFVVAEIEYCTQKFLNEDGKGWFDYLRLFENGDLEAAKTRFERELSPTYSPTSPSYIQDPFIRGETPFYVARSPSAAPPRDSQTPDHPTSADAANVTPGAGAAGGRRASKAENKSVKQSFLPGRERPTGIARRSGNITKAQQDRNEKHYANLRAKIPKRRRSPGGDAEDSPRDQKAPRSEAGSEIAASETIDTEIELQFATEAEARNTLYQDPKLKERWEKYSGQITTLTRHIILLINGQPVNFPEGSDSVVDILNGNPLTKKIYEVIYDVLENKEDLWNDLADQYTYTEIAYEYLVIDVMNEDVQEIADGLFERDPSVTEYTDWVSFLEKILPNVLDTPQLLAMRLGSELHTFPADASRELTIDNLTRKLDALRDW